MSNNIPFEIQEEIIKWLPVKSLIQFRSVSKAWKSLVDSSEFIGEHSLRAHTQPHHRHLFISYQDTVNYNQKYVMIVDDVTFPQQRLSPTVPVSVGEYSSVIGISHGLICLCVYPKTSYFDGQISGPDMAVLWNPTIRKSVAIDVPNVAHGCSKYQYFLSFGVRPDNCDPKLVMITHNFDPLEPVICQVQVFTLSSGTWRSPLCSNNLYGRSIRITSWLEVIDKYIYWYAYDRVNVDSRYESLIMSFDLVTEEFRELYLPDNFEHATWSISKLRESLVVLQYGKEAEKATYSVWMMMEHGVPESLTQLFTFKAPGTSVFKKVHGFRKNDEPIIHSESGALCVYEPNSEHINNLEIYGMACYFFVDSYLETLLMLDQ